MSKIVKKLNKAVVHIQANKHWKDYQGKIYKVLNVAYDTTLRKPVYVYYEVNGPEHIHFTMPVEKWLMELDPL